MMLTFMFFVWLEYDVANVKTRNTISVPQSLKGEVSGTGEFLNVTKNLSQKKKMLKWLIFTARGEKPESNICLCMQIVHN